MVSEEQLHLGDNADNTLYHSFKDSHPCWLFVGNAILKVLYVVPGIFLNISLLWITFRAKTLRGTANYLLALNSFFELLHQPGNFLIIFTSFSGLNFIEYPLAVRICTVSLFGLIAVGPSLLFTGIDRLFAVTFIQLYQRINPIVYLLAIACLCSAYSGYEMFLVYQTVGTAKWDHYMVTGTIGDLFQEEASEFYYVYTLILNGVTILIYILVGILIRFRTVDQIHWRMFRSLLAIISFGIGGYFLMRVYTNFIAPNVEWSATTIWVLRQTFAIPANVSAGSNAPILYWTSIEYRKAYRSELDLIVAYFKRHNWLKKGNNNVQVISNNTNNAFQRSPPSAHGLNGGVKR